ncbi:hypothetical protein [Aromatoleum anaerobium]|uniref:Glycosyltransferase RgtA/B/C/D-like domain-containing protein n=2 Tax=Aromatoleum TaxID=551759 RepID=A0ABX1PQM1_9RHOO|nr:hypothetical protein [Aromatoleum anaerobium]MCK0507044.1 hypothetical protein [Aromatoleum anaerobium]
MSLLVQYVFRLCRRIDPAPAAFIISLALSAIAVGGSSELNRDGMLYVDTARVLTLGGLDSGLARFDWIVLPALIAGLSTLTGLGFESAGYLLMALLMAGTCAMLVQCPRRLFPETAWAACLVALALPAFNEYRDHILREFGFWFFSLVAFWLALRWVDRPRWSLALAEQLAVAGAMAFRLEAAILYPALWWWQFRTAQRDNVASPLAFSSGRHALMLGVVPGLVLLMWMLTYMSGLFELSGRAASYLHSVNVGAKMELFTQQAARLADVVLNDLSRDEATYILFFGLLSMIPVKFAAMSGIFLVPLVFGFLHRSPAALLARWQPFGWAFAAYLLILAAFVTDRFFVTGRYASFLNMLAVPLFAAGLVCMMERWPRWRPWLVAIAAVSMLANVISLSPAKRQYAEAGAWLKARQPDAARVYIESRRVSYYAGRGFLRTPMERAVALEDLAGERFDLFVLEHEAADEAALGSFVQGHQLILVTKFEGPGIDVLVLAPRRANSPSPTR